MFLSSERLRVKAFGSEAAVSDIMWLQNTSDDGTFARMRLDELARLKDMLKRSEGEIQRLQALAVRMKTKGKLVHVAYMLFAWAGNACISHGTVITCRVHKRG